MSRSQALLAALALVAAAFFANLLLTLFGGRVDLTEDRTFTLSPASRRLVGKLDEPVKLELFVSRTDVKLGAYRESYARRVETLLRQYVAASGGKLRLIITDPKPDTKDEQRAQRHGLNGIRTPQGTGYLGLTAQQADTVKGIGYLDPMREKFLEYDLSKLVASVTRLERPKLALINTLNISNEVPPGQDQQAGPADVLLAELGQTFQVVTLSNQATELPAGVAVVVLLHPHHLADKLAYAVDQFLLGGGQVFAAVDPLSRFQKFQQGGMPFMMAPMAMGASSDAALLRGDGAEQLTAGQPWGRILLVAVLAALLVVGGGPIMSAARPIIDSLIGAAGASAEPSAAASDSATPLATPTATPSASVTPSPTPTATATPAPSSDSGTTYVVRKNDSLYKIACALPIGCNGYKAIAELNGIAGPEYVIKRGQVLKLP